MPRTERLLLRQWQDSDREPFAELNADPEVMRYLPATVDRAASEAAVDRFAERIAVDGYGIWAVEVVAAGEFAGFVGLNHPTWTAHFTSPEEPCTEVGWRLARRAWGHGYATEAGRAALEVAFNELGLDEVVSFATAAKPPEPRGDGAARDGIRPARRLRPPDHRRGQPDPPPCALPPASLELGQRSPLTVCRL